MDIMEFDGKVMRDAKLQLEKAARIVERLEHADTATEANRNRVASLLSEALANIHAAEARLK